MIARVRRSSITAQVAFLIAAGPFVVATVGLALVPLAAELSLVDQDPELVEVVARAVRLVLLFSLACGIVAAVGAGLVLRSSIGTAISAIQQATTAISGGRLTHRVEVDRADELGELARAINGMASRLETLEAGRRRMLATVSHELRTPLTVIRGHAWTLSRGARDERLRARLELIDQETVRLASLIDDLLDAATMHAGGGRLRTDRADLLAIVADSADRFHGDAAQRGVTIELAAADVAMPVDVDVERLHQALGNLLANAVAHAPATSVISIEVADVSESEWQVAVRNAGPAIPPAVLETLFEPFVQGPRATGRVGLGLSIARDIVEAHGGSISCRSTTGMTEFLLTIRAAPPSGGKPDASAEPVTCPQPGTRVFARSTGRGIPAFRPAKQVAQ